MQNRFSSSPLIKGVIEEIDIYKISLCNYKFHDSHSEQGDNMDELVLSIRQHGLLNPVIVRTSKSEFEIVAGYRRLIACKKLGLRRILCHVMEIDQKDAFEISLVENIQRKNLNPLEEGMAFKAYIFDFGWGGMSDLSTKISKSVSYISKRISLLDLPHEIMDEITKANITNSAAEELIFIKDKDKQLQIANQVIKKQMTVINIRRLAKEGKESPHIIEDVFNLPIKDKLEEIDYKAQRSFDKTITTLKIALNKVGAIIDDTEDNWIVYEILMQHKNMLNNQIDILIKEKKKI
jgi:ParB family transcriptional regulator, chromosome partitioning protein